MPEWRLTPCRQTAGASLVQQQPQLSIEAAVDKLAEKTVLQVCFHSLSAELVTPWKPFQGRCVAADLSMAAPKAAKNEQKNKETISKNVPFR